MPFDNNHYLLLNLAIGGILGGEVSKSFLEEKNSKSFIILHKGKILEIDDKKKLMNRLHRFLDLARL